MVDKDENNKFIKIVDAHNGTLMVVGSRSYHQSYQSISKSEYRKETHPYFSRVIKKNTFRGIELCSGFFMI